MKCLKNKGYVTVPDCKHCNLLEKCIDVSEFKSGSDPRFIATAYELLGMTIPPQYCNRNVGWITEYSDVPITEYLSFPNEEL